MATKKLTKKKSATKKLTKKKSATKKVRGRAPDGERRYSQFFLYLPANGGQEWIDAVKDAAAEDGVTPSGWIRQWLQIGTTVLWRQRVVEAAESQGVTPQQLITTAVNKKLRTK